MFTGIKKKNHLEVLNSKTVGSLESMNLFQHFQNGPFELWCKAMFVGQV